MRLFFDAFPVFFSFSSSFSSFSPQNLLKTPPPCLYLRIGWQYWSRWRVDDDLHLQQRQSTQRQRRRRQLWPADDPWLVGLGGEEQHFESVIFGPDTRPTTTRRRWRRWSMEWMDLPFLFSSRRRRTAHLLLFRCCRFPQKYDISAVFLIYWAVKKGKMYFKKYFKNSTKILTNLFAAFFIQKKYSGTTTSAIIIISHYQPSMNFAC
jgi:hypothetical protein